MQAIGRTVDSDGGMMSGGQIQAIRRFALRAMRSRKARSVFAGNGVGQVIALAAVPLIARLFDAAAVGAFGLFSAVVTALAVVSCLALDQAIPLAASNREARGLQIGSAAVLLGFVLLFGLALLAAEPFGLGRLRMLGSNAALLPAAVLMTGMVQIALQSATQRRDFKALSRGFAVRTGGTALAQVAIAFVLADGTGMIVGQMLAVGATLLLLSGSFFKGLPSWREVWGSLLRHRNCPLYLAPRLAVGAAGDVGMLLLVGIWFGPQEVGYYWMAGRLLQVPGGFIDAPTRQLFMSAALEARARTGHFTTVLLAASLGLLAISGTVALGLLLVGHPLFRIVLGSNWEPAVPFVQIIAFGWVFDFAAIPFSNAVLLLGIQRQHFIFDMIQRVLVLGGLAVGCLHDDLLLGCALTSAVRVVLGICFGSYLIMCSHKPVRSEVADGLAPVHSGVTEGQVPIRTELADAAN
jgi:O-antigen/teichoic acid export membrane protein